MARRIAVLCMGASVFVALLAVTPASGAPAFQVATCTNPTATMTITPNTLAPSQQAVLNGSGFSPNSPISFTQDGQNVGVTNVTTDASGQFTFNGTASPNAGTHTVTASDATGRCATSTYTVGGTGTTYGTGVCPAGYVQSGNQCVLSGTAYYGGVNPCPPGWTLSNTTPYTPTTVGYPYNYGSPGYPSGGQCVPIGYTGTPGVAGPCPAGYAYSGTACTLAATATTVYTPPAVQQPAAAPQPAAAGGVAYTGLRTVRTAAVALGLLFTGLLMLSARRLATARRAA